MHPVGLARSLARSRLAGYSVAVIVPVVLTWTATWLNIPAFIFEDLALLTVLGIAIPWGLGPATVAVVACVATDNVLVLGLIGRPTVTGYRDVIDLLLFATVAIVVSGLVTRARTASLTAQESADRERKAREDRDRLIATVAHDLATPLSVLNGTVQFVRLRGPAEVDWSRLLDRLATASARATSLVRMLSDAQALETNTFGLTLRTHDLRTVVSPIVQMMDRYSAQHPVVLSVPDEPVLVEADADRLQRVLENLVSNAIKYSPDGGTVEVSVASDADAGFFRVRDYGIGISEAALPHIFERSYRAPEASTHAPGLGLGLSIAARVVEKHRGVISAAAAEGRGTIVVVRLPLARERVQPREEHEAQENVRV